MIRSGTNTFRMRIARAIGCVAAALLCLSILANCGGPLALTGGSVPVGASRFSGRVVRADDVTMPVGNADVTVALTTGSRSATRASRDGDPPTGGIGGSGGTGGSGGSGGGLPNTRKSGPNGEFDFGTIGSGDFTITINPPGGFDLQNPWAWSFTLPSETSGYMIAAQWPTWFKPETVNAVTIAPESITLRPGESIRFVYSATDTSGVVIPLSPSLLLLGSTGGITADGTYTAVNTGHAQVVAWLAGKNATANIVVIPGSR